jgi:prevent-host-death family protein
MGIEMSVTEFKAKCLDLIDKLARHEIDSIELTKRGKPVAVVSPKEAAKPKTMEEALAELREWQKGMRGLLWIDPEYDLTQPTGDLEEMNAYHGRLLSQDE